MTHLAISNKLQVSIIGQRGSGLICINIYVTNYSTVNYLTSFAAAFPCFNEIHNKAVKFIYIAGDRKVTFDVDMSKLK